MYYFILSFCDLYYTNSTERKVKINMQLLIFIRAQYSPKVN